MEKKEGRALREQILKPIDISCLETTPPHSWPAHTPVLYVPLNPFKKPDV